MSALSDTQRGGLAAAERALLAVRFAGRELRGGLRGFGVFVACIALGVFAIAGVGSVADSLAEGLAAAGQTILGGDLSFSLVQRQASTSERAFLTSHGAVSAIASMRAMARVTPATAAPPQATPGHALDLRAPGDATLVELKAVDDAYPLFGSVVTDPAAPLHELLAARDGAFGAVVDPALLDRLNLRLGDRIRIGNAVIALRARLLNEPDKLSSGIGFGPRVLISAAALQASGLLQPGSLVRWSYRLRLPAKAASDAAVAAVESQARAEFANAGWEIRTRDRASPQLERNMKRFAQFLTLVGLTTLIVGGIGVANAVTAHLNRKRDAIGTMKALGASGGDIFALYGAEIVLVALAATAIGAGLGAALPFALSYWLGGLIPFPVTPALHPGILALSCCYGVLTALAFALWPLGRAHDISAAMLFRDDVAPERRWPRARYIAAMAVSVAAFAALAVFTAGEHRVAAIFIGAAAGILLLLRLTAAAVMRLARALPRGHSPILRLAIANIHRPGALTPTLMLSLGLGFALLSAVIEIDGNLHREFSAALPAKAPSFFFLDVPAAEADRFDRLIQTLAPGATLERVPMLRGRIIAANGVKAADLHPAAESRWVLRGDRGITYAEAVPPGSRVVDGHWWSADYSGPPLVSLESRTARDFNLKVGDTITVNVLGRTITARIANLRAVDWASLGINFVMVFSPATFAGAPHNDIATLTFADGGTTAEETALIKALARTFPSVAAIRIKDALTTLDGIVRNLVLALRGASSVSLLAAALVLGGALAAGQRSRLFDAVLLKTLGATRARLLAAYACEYLLVGLAAVLIGLAVGSIAAALIVTRVMEFSFSFVPGEAAVTAAAALSGTIILGLFGTVAALGRKPAAVLRNL